MRRQAVWGLGGVTAASVNGGYLGAQTLDAAQAPGGDHWRGRIEEDGAEAARATDCASRVQA